MDHATHSRSQSCGVNLESTRTLSADMLMKDGYRQSGPRLGQGRYDVDAFLRESRDATLVCYCRVSSAKQRDDLARQVAVTRETPPWRRDRHRHWRRTQLPVERDLSPYWNDYTEELNSVLWLPIKTGLRDLDSTLSGGRLSENGGEILVLGGDGFTAPNRSSPRIFSPSCTPSVAGCTACAATATQSRRIRVYPTGDQRRTLRLWFDAARWCYNEAVARLRRTGEPANWKAIKTEIIHAVPERLRAAPYEVKSISVRDACRAVSEVRRRNRQLAKRNKYRAASRMRVRIGNLTAAGWPRTSPPGRPVAGGQL